MNAEVVVKKLRRAERYCLNEYSQMARQAADLIESLQAQLSAAHEELEKYSPSCSSCERDCCVPADDPDAPKCAFECPGYMSERGALIAKVSELEGQSSAAQRRERAAMKAMEETAADVEAMAKEFEELSREWTEAWARTRALGHRDPDTGQWVVDDPDRELRERWVRNAHREALRHADDVGQGIDNRLAALRGRRWMRR